MNMAGHTITIEAPSPMHKRSSSHFLKNPTTSTKKEGNHLEGSTWKKDLRKSSIEDDLNHLSPRKLSKASIVESLETPKGSISSLHRAAASDHPGGKNSSGMNRASSACSLKRPKNTNQASGLDQVKAAQDTVADL